MDTSLDRSSRLRFAGAALLVSAPIAAVAVASLTGMFAGFAVGARGTALALGRTNDILAIPTLLLLAPAVAELSVVVSPDRRSLRVVLTAVGIGSIAWISWLQWLLVTEQLTFEEQVGPVTLGFAGLGAWFVVTGRVASRAGLMRGGTGLGVAAALFVGQPWWALRWGRRLLELARA